jgi:hypothetical protein
MKVRPVEAEFHADGRTDISKLTVAIRNCANAPKLLHIWESSAVAGDLLSRQPCCWYSATGSCDRQTSVTENTLLNIK